MEEAAASLGEAGRKLQRALDALAEHASWPVNDAEVHALARAELVACAGEALWGLVVQRELLGFRDQDFIAKHYDVPNEVWLAMGPRIRKPEAK